MTIVEVFYSVPLENATLSVPRGTYEKYANTEVWKEFGNIIEYDFVETGIAAQAMGAKGDEKIFDLSGHKLSAPRKGVNIVNGKKVLVK